MVADDPTKSDATGLPVPPNLAARDEAEADKFAPQGPQPEVAMAGAGEGELTPESDLGDVDMMLEEQEPVAEPVSTEMEHADEDREPDAGGVVLSSESRRQAESDEVDQGAEGDEAPAVKDWYILKVQVNREDTIRAALLRRIKIEGLEECFDEIVVPTEEVAEFNKSGKRKVVKRKLYPGYILVHMVVNDDTWFLVRETPGVGDFTGSSGKPTPMNARDVERILRLGVTQGDSGVPIKTAIPFRVGDRVRVKDGHFQNFEGEVDSIDEANGRITVMINIFNRSTPVELEHWQVETV
jgi:transcription termination/antitermination protein NusG